MKKFMSLLTLLVMGFVPFTAFSQNQPLISGTFPDSIPIGEQEILAYETKFVDHFNVSCSFSGTTNLPVLNNGTDRIWTNYYNSLATKYSLTNGPLEEYVKPELWKQSQGSINGGPTWLYVSVVGCRSKNNILLLRADVVYLLNDNTGHYSVPQSITNQVVLTHGSMVAIPVGTNVAYATVLLANGSIYDTRNAAHAQMLAFYSDYYVLGIGASLLTNKQSGILTVYTLDRKVTMYSLQTGVKSSFRLDICIKPTGKCLNILGEPGMSVIVESSPDFKNWQTLVTLANPTGALEYTDGKNALGCFYRLRYR